MGQGADRIRVKEPTESELQFLFVSEMCMCVCITKTSKLAPGQTNKQNKQTTHRIMETKAGQTDLKFRSRAARTAPMSNHATSISIRNGNFKS